MIDSFFNPIYFSSRYCIPQKVLGYTKISHQKRKIQKEIRQKDVGRRGRGAAEEILITNRGIIIRGGNLVELSRRVATSLHATSPPGRRPTLPLHRHRIDLAYQYTGESRGKHLTKKLTIFQNSDLLDFSTAFKKFLSDDKQKIHPVTFDELP